MKTAFFTWITNNYRDTNIDFQSFSKSFKYFHPEVDLIIFDDSVIKPLFQSKPWLTTTNCKASFAKLIYDKYDLLINVDSDFYFFDRCDEILIGDYDIAGCANYNIVQNVMLKKQTIDHYEIPYIDELHYVQGGMIASTKKEFWDEYENLSYHLANKLPLYENDVLNILWSSGKYKTKILDGDYDYRSENFLCYYNCASLGRISNTVIKNDKVYLDNKPMRSYHVAHGWHRRKDRVHELFPKQVSDWFYSKIQ
jgi:hypothetical protein